MPAASNRMHSRMIIVIVIISKWILDPFPNTGEYELPLENYKKN